MIDNRMIIKRLAGASLLPEVTTSVLWCVAEWEWRALRHFGLNDKRFLLGGSENFSRRLYAQTGSRICPDSYPRVLPLRVNHVNHEAVHCYAEILNVLYFTSTRHRVVFARRTRVGLHVVESGINFAFLEGRRTRLTTRKIGDAYWLLGCQLA